jgi:hypothetical protein
MTRTNDHRGIRHAVATAGSVQLVRQASGVVSLLDGPSSHSPDRRRCCRRSRRSVSRSHLVGTGSARRRRRGVRRRRRRGWRPAAYSSVSRSPPGMVGVGVTAPRRDIGRKLQCCCSTSRRGQQRTDGNQPRQRDGAEAAAGTRRWTQSPRRPSGRSCRWLRRDRASTNVVTGVSPKPLGSVSGEEESMVAPAPGAASTRVAPSTSASVTGKFATDSSPRRRHRIVEGHAIAASSEATPCRSCRGRR